MLVVGGRDAAGHVIALVERLDPAAGTGDVVATPGLTPRAFQGATLLPDGRVLLTGGLSGAGLPLDTAERWDPETGRSEPVSAPLTTARAGHTSSLLPDGTVLLWGGRDATGAPLAGGDVLDPATAQVTPLAAVPPGPAATDAPAITGALPADGATGVLPDRRLALWLSKPLRPDTVTADTVTLTGPDGAEPLQVVAAEGGRLLLVLRLGADYHPGLSRFITEDPLGLEGGTNFYSYVGNNPIGAVDPLGLAPVRIDPGEGGPYGYKPEGGDNVIRLCWPGQTCDVDGIYPRRCDRFPIKIVDGCEGNVSSGQLSVSCRFYNPNAPTWGRAFPYIGQLLTGGPTNEEFHDRNPGWPRPPRNPDCSCR